jgi:cell division protein ZapA
LEKVRTIVNIGGKEYTIAGSESAEYIHRVALCVNQKMSELKRGNEQLNNTLLAVLTAINIADDYIKAKDELVEVKKELECVKQERETRKPQVNVSKFR